MDLLVRVEEPVTPEESFVALGLLSVLLGVLLAFWTDGESDE